MNTIKTVCLAIAMAAATENVMAGGLLTNTNQNIAFLRNPARDGAIGIDGVYSNPAGVAFMPQGLHLSLNIQNAHQTRTVTSTFAPFTYGANNNGNSTKEFKGKADAPAIPSIQAAYNHNDWSFQFNFAITGGGGKCVFDNGLGSLESHMALLPLISQNLDNVMGVIGQKYPELGVGAMGLPSVTSYKMDTYMRGRQYYYGFSLGAARKLNDHWSIYGGVRLLYGTSNYYGYISNIQVKMQGEEGQSQFVSAKETFRGQAAVANQKVGELKQAATEAAAAGNVELAQKYAEAAKSATVKATMLGALGSATEDVTLNCNQTGWGIAPILGVDFKTGNFNFAAKYEFKTRMELKNEAANSESAADIELLDRWRDGDTVDEDSPALLTVGAQWDLLPDFRINAGYHHYFDKDAKAALGHQKKLGGDTNEYLFGAEYDITKAVQVSAGGQFTRYNFTDDYMEDLSFNVSSFSFGIGVGIKLSEKMKLNLAYFQTNYQNYDRENNNYYNLSGMAGNIVGGVVGNLGADANTTAGIVETTKQLLTTPGKDGKSMLNGADSFTRTNRVIGIGLDINI